MPVAIVTGGNTGIGRATAVALAAAGFDIGFTWQRDEERAAAATREIERSGARCRSLHLDLHVVHEGAQAVDELAEALGGVNVLVNNAGYGTSKPFLEMTLGEWQGVIDTNLTGAFQAAQAAARRMVDQAQGERSSTSPPCTSTFPSRARPRIRRPSTDSAV